MTKTRKNTPKKKPADDVVVRPAVRADARVIAKLARGLNLHEGDPTGNFTEKVVLRDGFGRTPQFKCLLAELRGKVVGYALLVDAYETGWGARGLYLNDLYVEERARRRGVARALVAACAAVAKRRKKTYVWWASKSGNKRAQAFYKKVGAFEERVVAHALAFKAFEAMAAEGRVRRSAERKARRKK